MLINKKLILVIYKTMFIYSSNRIVAHIMVVKCGNLIHWLSGGFVYLEIEVYVLFYIYLLLLKSIVETITHDFTVIQTAAASTRTEQCSTCYKPDQTIYIDNAYPN